jgi:hypothetical protein
LCAQEVGDAAADDDSVGGGSEAGKVSDDHVLADGGDAELFFGFYAEEADGEGFGAVGCDGVAIDFGCDGDDAVEMAEFFHEPGGVFDFLDVFAGFYAGDGDERVGCGVDAFEDFGAGFAGFVVDGDVAGGFDGFEDELVFEAAHHGDHGDEHGDGDGDAGDADEGLSFVGEEVAEGDVPAHGSGLSGQIKICDPNRFASEAA